MHCFSKNSTAFSTKVDTIRMVVTYRSVKKRCSGFGREVIDGEEGSVQSTRSREVKAIAAMQY